MVLVKLPELVVTFAETRYQPFGNSCTLPSEKFASAVVTVAVAGSKAKAPRETADGLICENISMSIPPDTPDLSFTNKETVIVSVLAPDKSQYGSFA